MIDEILERIDDAETIDLCRRLVRIKSVNPPGGERGVAEFVAGYLREAGLEAELVEHAPERASVLARLPGGEEPGLLLSAHLDTVPVGAERWIRDPFAGDLAEGKVWGRGSTDMKGGLAAMMAAARALAKARAKLRGDVILALTAGEEVDSLGATAIAARKDIRNVRAVLVSEPSSNEIFVAEKGALWLEVSIYGKTAHGSMPELGCNAIMMMNAFLDELKGLKIPYEEHPMLGGFSQSVNTIAGGVKTNVVPDLCTATIDMRTVPGQDNRAIVRQIEALLSDLATRLPGFRGSAKVTNDRQPVTTSPDHPLVKQFNEALAKVRGRASEPKGVRYYTDAASFVPALQVPMIICGPGEAGLAHQPNEYVDARLLAESARIYAAAVARILGS